MPTWIKDKYGNKCSVEYFGSVEAAQQALDSLSKCRNCTNCSRCYDCSSCSISGGNAPPIPIIENIDAVVLAACSVKNALNMQDWHTCDTTHCRAGWVIHLAGEAGYALERFHDTPLAAQLIYRESGSPIHPARFYDDNKSAMEDMKKRVIVK